MENFTGFDLGFYLIFYVPVFVLLSVIVGVLLFLRTKYKQHAVSLFIFGVIFITFLVLAFAQTAKSML